MDTSIVETSSPSYPAITLNIDATSSTVLHIGPMVSNVKELGITPRLADESRLVIYRSLLPEVALALRAGMSYEELLRRRIFDPLGMTDTTIPVNVEQRSRRATGYNAKLSSVPPWTGGVVAPAGGVNSTSADMLKFAAAVIDSQNPLKAVFARMMSIKRSTEESRVQQGLGWGLFSLGANDILAHSGGTFGCPPEN